jgi:hypothetical protein
MQNSPDSHQGIEDPQEETPYSRNLKELQRRRESGEIADEDFNFIQWWVNHSENPRPLEKADIGREALVLSYEEFEQIGFLDIILPSGEICLLYFHDLKAQDGLIIFPEELG